MANKKWKGATVVEVVVALIIMMIVFGIATTTYVRLMNSSNHPRLTLQQQLATIASQMNTQSPVLSEQVYHLPNNITVQARISPYKDMESLLLLELEAVDRQDKRLAVYKKIWMEVNNDGH